MNYADVLIAGLVILALILAVRWIIRQKKRGSCAGCSGCSNLGNCKAYEAFDAEAREKLQNKNSEENVIYAKKK